MHVAVAEATGFPDEAYVSIRVGNTRRQAPWQHKDKLFFPCGDSRNLHLDVFNKLGCAHVKLEEHLVDPSAQRIDVAIPQVAGADMNVGLTVEMVKGGNYPTATVLKHAHENGVKIAMDYMETSGCQRILSRLVQQLMLNQPSEPLAFMAEYIAKATAEVSNQEKQPCEAPDQETLGEDADEVCTEPLSEELPDLSKHFSFLAEVLKKDPDIYKTLRCETTSLNVTFKDVTKPGLEVKGHPMIKSAGIHAGDADSFNIFAPVLDPIIVKFHGDALNATHHTGPEAIQKWTLDSPNKHVAGVRLQASRNVDGFRFPTACSRKSRREVETMLVGILGNISEGTYYPLAGSNSFSKVPGGMQIEDAMTLEKHRALFWEPDSAALSSVARDWPDARGVYWRSDKQWAWLNGEDHIRMFSAQTDADVTETFTRLFTFERVVAQALRAKNCDFARNDRLGFLTPYPNFLGTCLVATIFLRLPLLAQTKDFRKTCKDLDVQAELTEGDVWGIYHSGRLGLSEVDQVNKVVAACETLVRAEEKHEETRS